MKAVAVNGISKSGKTTVCEALISVLRRRGYTVGSVKEIHFEAFAIDPDPTTNTRRHRAAGADLVTARGMYETDILYQTKLPMEEIFRHYNHDFLVLEGVSDCNVLSIVTAHSVEAVQDHLDERTAAVSGVVANTGLKEFGDCLFLIFSMTQRAWWILWRSGRLSPYLPLNRSAVGVWIQLPGTGWPGGEGEGPPGGLRAVGPRSGALHSWYRRAHGALCAADLKNAVLGVAKGCGL